LTAQSTRVFSYCFPIISSNLLLLSHSIPPLDRRACVPSILFPIGSLRESAPEGNERREPLSIRQRSQSSKLGERDMFCLNQRWETCRRSAWSSKKVFNEERGDFFRRAQTGVPTPPEKKGRRKVKKIILSWGDTVQWPQKNGSL